MDATELPVRWPDDVDEVIEADVVAALAYRTPAGGAVVTGISPIGIRDRGSGTVGFTTSLGFGRKLERIRRNPQVALAYHAREHGRSRSPDYVLVQGRVSSVVLPDEQYLRSVIGPRSEPYLGPPAQGWFWDRWLSVYYRDRVIVTIEVQRVARWPRLDAGGEPQVIGPPLPGGALTQSTPQKGTGPRINCRRAARRLAGVSHRLLAFVQPDGNPMIVPISISGVSAAGLSVQAPSRLLPVGGCRAGLLGHEFNEQVAGLTSRQYTGWLAVGDQAGGGGRYAPHSERSLVIPHSKTVALLLNGLAATLTYRAAVRAGRTRLLDE